MASLRSERTPKELDGRIGLIYISTLSHQPGLEIRTAFIFSLRDVHAEVYVICKNTQTNGNRLYVICEQMVK